MLFLKDKFNQYRKMRGLSADKIAAVCGVTRQTVYRWIKPGEAQPRPAKIPVLAKLLECSEKELALYGGPFEMAIDSAFEQEKKLRECFFTDKIATEHMDIAKALLDRAEYEKGSPEYERCNSEIMAALMSMFQKMSTALDVVGMPPDYDKLLADTISEFKFGLIRKLITSDMSAVEKEKALRIVEKFTLEDEK